MRINSAFLATAVAACLASAAVAQPPGGGRGGRGGMAGMMGGGGGATLAVNPSVQEELKLTDDQKSKLKELTDGQRTKMREAMQKARDGGGEFDREAFTKLMKESTEAGDKAIKEVLNADQQKRLQQIKWQAAGVAAFVDTDLQTKLKFNDDQKTKFKGIADEVAKDVQQLFRDAEGNFEGIREKVEGLRKEAQTNAEKILTDDQKKEWKASLGTPFEVKPDPNARGGFGGPGGGGGEKKDDKGTRPGRRNKGGDKGDDKKDAPKKDAPKKPKIDD